MEHHLQPGVILAGKYRIERVLGQGGMGVVVAATHVQLGQRVALKFLLPGAVGHGEAVARFLREARTAVQLQSEHVARVSDVGTFDDGAPFIVMEYLEGRDLSEVLRERGPLPVAVAVDYVLQALDAIAEAHSLGMVHRDLKPSNLFLAQRRGGADIVKVLDFGISKAAGDGPAANLTATSAIMGSPLYMSPEQVRSSRDVDARSDIWTIGVILHELIAGEPPFSGETMTAVLAMIAADPPPLVRETRPEAPKGLEDLILRCLEKDRSRRFADVAELAHALSAFASDAALPRVQRISKVLGKPVAAAPNVHAPRPDERLPTGGAWANTAGSLRGANRRRPLYLVIGGVVVASAAILVVTQAQRGAEPTLTPQAGPPSSVGNSTESASAAILVVPSSVPRAAVAKAEAAPSISSARATEAPVTAEKSAAVVTAPSRAQPARGALPKRSRGGSAPEIKSPVPAATALPAKQREVPQAPPPKSDRGLFDDTK